MKKIGILLLSLITFATSKAQLNLIADSSFEDTINTLNSSRAQMCLKNWHNLDSNIINFAGTWYSSYNNQSPAYVLPTNQWLYQQTRNGNGIVAFDFTWLGLGPNYFARSLARTKLKTKLIAGKTYCAKMYVNPCDKYYDTFTDGIAMYFDNGQLDTIVAQDSSGIYPFVNPQVSNPQGNVLSDTANWVLVSGTFVATGTETFMTIGNFKTDANTTLQINPATYDSINPVQASGLLIDDVSVIEVTASNWLKDTTITFGDSVYIGLPKYDVPDAKWYNYNMGYIATGSGIKVKPTQSVTKYIQAIDVCNSMRYDTVTVYAFPLAVTAPAKISSNFEATLFPNPTSNGFDIKSNCTDNCSVKVQITNITGQLIMTKDCDLLLGNCFVNTTLPNGTYLVKITKSSSQESVISKLTINNN